MSNNTKPILVIGGGIAGMTAAVEAAEYGCEVILVEQEAYLGGRVVKMNQYFPKLCPPTCGLEINIQRIRNNKRVTVHTLAKVAKVSGSRGDFTVTIEQQPRYVKGALTPAHYEAVSSEVDDGFNYNMSKVKALSMAHDQAYPPLAVAYKDALTDGEKAALADAPIDFDEEAKTFDVNVGAIIVATGWQPYDANNLDLLGYKDNADVITNVEMERLAARRGPSEGKILRPSDGKEPARVAFVQCAGSRDTNHNGYCSAVCCMGSLKQARYVREKLPEAQITIFYIDIRTIGRHESFYYDLLGDDKVSFLKGKVAKVVGGKSAITLTAEDTLGGGLVEQEFDLVVLATGVVPTKLDVAGLELQKDHYGFVVNPTERNGIYGVGCALRPTEVSRSVKDATAAALHAIQDVRR